NIFVITGAIQTGKTTWIARMLEQADRCGLQVSGVLAPAVFEDGVKTGIDALLLPSGERFELARKNPAFEQLHKEATGVPSADPTAAAVGQGALATVSGTASSARQDPQPAADARGGDARDSAAAARRVRLAWGMSDAALARINEHFRSLRSTGFGQLMVVDEFGPLEFSGGQGYTEGMAVMDESLPANALLVLRPTLLDTARQRWGDFDVLDVDSPIGPFLEKIAR
ncbi:MAG: nucleoside-triphosphatase, partial [Coriobacteriales bacterium]